MFSVSDFSYTPGGSSWIILDVSLHYQHVVLFASCRGVERARIPKTDMLPGSPQLRKCHYEAGYQYPSVRRKRTAKEEG